MQFAILKKYKNKRKFDIGPAAHIWHQERVLCDAFDDSKQKLSKILRLTEDDEGRRICQNCQIRAKEQKLLSPLQIKEYDEANAKRLMESLKAHELRKWY